MAFTPGGSEGALNGTTEVSLIGAPGSATQRIIRCVTIHNKDTAAVTITVSKKKSATLRRIVKVTLDPDETLELGVQVLDDTDESLVAVMSGAAATSDPEFTSSYGDAT